MVSFSVFFCVFSLVCFKFVVSSAGAVDCLERLVCEMCRVGLYITHLLVFCLTSKVCCCVVLCEIDMIDQSEIFLKYFNTLTPACYIYSKLNHGCATCDLDTSVRGTS